MTETIISLKNINFKYNDVKVIEDVDLEIHRGDFLGIIGSNGSGKTTLLKIMLGLLKNQEGEVLLFNEPIKKFKEWWKIGYVPQKVTQFDIRFPITVEEVVSLGRIGTVGLGRPLSHHDDIHIHHSLAIVGMSNFKDRHLSELSGGEQQRVFIAKALASDPELLILDEPTVGIDMESQEKFYELLSELNKVHGITIVMVSHDIDVVVNEVSNIVCINKKIVYQGSPKEFIKEDYSEKLYGKGRKFILHGH